VFIFIFKHQKLIGSLKYFYTPWI